ncbi:syntabulin isoform X2 [Electrophorus electricus]|uniref:syntabulin isoform X2 n=1 Tax=Electrophorus electricus TaxID=8005 RepID=UPI0015CFB37F|nr:syntabulin isoform X2 [Electrophorus electricus]
MGPFQEYEVKKASGKGSTRSRIPRPVLQPFNSKGSPISELPFSEEESKCHDISTEHSKRTISPNSFSSDDTGCPSSQCASPVKMASGWENSPEGSPPARDRKAKVKRVRVSMMAEWTPPTQKHKREQQHHSASHRGSEADFKTHEILANSSTVKKSCSARRRTTSGCYRSCGDNHGINPPNPEQYLTPLQQKEVTIRHLKTKLKESEQTLHARDSEIQELNSQLGRMREDWIEEECHRVEAQLALKEARKEIKQLRQVVETMKNSLMEKDKGIQKYFIDINIQNRKLESLLHSMELAQSGASLHDEPTLDFIAHSPERPHADKLEEELQVDDEVLEEMVDSGLPVNDEMANQMDNLEQALLSTVVDSGQDCSTKLMNQPKQSTIVQGASKDTEKSTKDEISREASAEEQHEEKAVQTEEVLSSPDLQALLLQLLKFQNNGLSSLMTPSTKILQRLPKAQKTNMPQEKTVFPVPSSENGVGQILNDSTPDKLVISQDPGGSNQSYLKAEMDPVFMEELDFDAKDASSSANMAVVAKNHWSNNFLVDLVAVAAPVLPTVAWLYSQHGVVGGAPVYNIVALIRGCCIMGLHSLRHVTHGPHM